MSRGLALPAVACLVLGVVLGVWGWGQRDEARARIVPEEEVVEEDGFLAPPPIDPAAQLEQTCATLRAASRLEQPPVGGLDVGQEGMPPDPALTGFVLLTVLDPDIVVGVGPLDRPDVRAAIEDQAQAVDLALSTGVDVTADPEVLRTAEVLGRALDGTC